MKTQNTFSHEATDNQVNNFAASFCPFGWLDMQASLNNAYNAGYDEDWATERIKDFISETGNEMYKIDVVYVVLDSILQEARNEIEQATGFDIQNDASFETYGNYMASSYDWNKESMKALKEKLKDVDTTEFSTATQYFLSEIGI